MEDIESLKSLDLKGLKFLCDKYAVKKYGTKDSLRTKLQKTIEESMDKVEDTVEMEDEVFQEAEEEAVDEEYNNDKMLELNIVTKTVPWFVKHLFD